MFVLNPKQVTGICDEIIKSGYGEKLNFWAYARIDTLEDNEMLKKMIPNSVISDDWVNSYKDSGETKINKDGVLETTTSFRILAQHAYFTYTTL